MIKPRFTRGSIHAMRSYSSTVKLFKRLRGRLSFKKNSIHVLFTRNLSSPRTIHQSNKKDHLSWEANLSFWSTILIGSIKGRQTTRLVWLNSLRRGRSKRRRTRKNFYRTTKSTSNRLLGSSKDPLCNRPTSAPHLSLNRSTLRNGLQLWVVQYCASIISPR